MTDFLTAAAFNTMEVAAGWDYKGTEGNLREFFAFLIGIGFCIAVIKAYQQGKKALVVIELITGSFAVGLVSTGNPLKAIGSFVMSMLGLGS